MNIYLVRHGESIGNSKKIYLGHTDLDLSERGYKQAELFCDYFTKNYKVDKIYSSDLIRAYNTVLPVAKKLNLEIHKDTQMREIYAGLWENKEYQYLIEKYSETYNQWLTDIGNAKCDGGETVKELKDRIIKRLYELAEENKDKDILIGTHATPIRIIKCIFSGFPIDEMHNVDWAYNASLTHLTYKNGTFEIVDYNIHSYLGDYVKLPSSKM